MGITCREWRVIMIKVLILLLTVCLHQALGFYWGGWGWGGFPINDVRIYGGYNNGYGIWGFDGDMNTFRNVPYRPIPIRFGGPIIGIDQRNVGQGQAANTAQTTSDTQNSDTSGTQTPDTSGTETTEN